MNKTPTLPQDMTDDEILAVIELSRSPAWSLYMGHLDRLRQRERDICENPPQGMSERILGQHQGRSLQLKNIVSIADLARTLFEAKEGGRNGTSG